MALRSGSAGRCRRRRCAGDGRTGCDSRSPSLAESESSQIYLIS
jgi:hypothetical protein